MRRRVGKEGMRMELYRCQWRERLKWIGVEEEEELC